MDAKNGPVGWNAFKVMLHFPSKLIMIFVSVGWIWLKPLYPISNIIHVGGYSNSPLFPCPNCPPWFSLPFPRSYVKVTRPPGRVPAHLGEFLRGGELSKSGGELSQQRGRELARRERVADNSEIRETPK